MALKCIGELDVDNLQDTVGPGAHYDDLPAKEKDTTSLSMEVGKKWVLQRGECDTGVVSFESKPKDELCM